MVTATKSPERSAVSPPQSEARRGLRYRPATVIGAGVVSGVLVGLSFPPYNFGLLAFVGFVPLFWVATTPRRGLLVGAIAGFVTFGFLLSWVFALAWFGWVVVVGWMSIVFIMFGLLAGYLTRMRTPFLWRLLLLPSMLAFAEWLQGVWPGGFAGQLGVSQHGMPFTRAIVAVGGVALATWLIVAFNVGLYGIVEAALERSLPGLLWPSVAIVAVIAAFGAGWLARPSQAPVGSLDLAIVQANDLPGVDVASVTLLNKHIAATRSLPRDDYDVVLWSESSLGALDLDDNLGRRITAASGGVPVLANSYVEHPTEPLFYNRNVLFDGEGKPVWTYDKRKLVPFGEYVPFREQLSWIETLANEIPRDGVRGEVPGIFEINGVPIGSLICFETAIAWMPREVVNEGAQAIVTSINNASYGFSSESEQFLAVARLRAAETHRSMAVSAVSGRSAAVLPSGDLIDETGLFEVATIEWVMPLQTDRTIYVRLGEWVVVLSALVLAGGIAYGWIRRAARRSHLNP